MDIVWQLYGHAYRNVRVGQQSGLPIYDDVEYGGDDLIWIIIKFHKRGGW